MSLGRKLLTFGVLFSVVPLAVVGTSAWYTGRRAQQVAHEGTAKVAHANLEDVARLAYLASEASANEMHERVATALRAARTVLAARGTFGVDHGRRTSWQARNQVTAETRAVTLPVMTLGGAAIEQNWDARQPTASVDSVRAAVGAAATIFLRMNDQGDMLRVATNVIGNDGRRAIGTYIGATNAGARSPVIAAVLDGRTFVGRAFVVSEWYLAAYEPIRSGGEIVGMLFVGVPEKQTTDFLLERLKSIRIGRTGYVSVLTGSGQGRGTYVLSRERRRDGENVWQWQDAAGQPFVQALINEAIALDPQRTGALRTAWQEPDESAPTVKVVRFRYFKPWDWVIVASVPDHELMEAADEVRRLNSRSIRVLLGVILASLLITAGVSRTVSRRAASHVHGLVADLATSAQRIASSAGVVAATSEALSQAATEQAASLGQTSASMQDVAAMTRGNAQSSQQAADLMREVASRVTRSTEALAAMVTSMTAIESSSQRVSKVIGTIDEIAFQTNLLALNAAVEAARAGAAGTGFTVVAGEVRTLAQRSAEEARRTATLIEESLAASRHGATQVAQVSEAMSGIRDSVATLGRLVDEVTRASHAQSQGIDQVTRAITDMENVTRANAASAQESAAASQELNAQAEVSMVVSARLDALVTGRHVPAPGEMSKGPAAGTAAPHLRAA